MHQPPPLIIEDTVKAPIEDLIGDADADGGDDGAMKAGKWQRQRQKANKSPHKDQSQHARYQLKNRERFKTAFPTNKEELRPTNKRKNFRIPPETYFATLAQLT